VTIFADQLPFTTKERVLRKTTSQLNNNTNRKSWWRSSLESRVCFSYKAQYLITKTPIESIQIGPRCARDIPSMQGKVAHLK